MNLFRMSPLGGGHTKLFYKNRVDAQVSGWGFAAMESGKVGREEAKRGLGHGVAGLWFPRRDVQGRGGARGHRPAACRWSRSTQLRKASWGRRMQSREWDRDPSWAEQQDPGLEERPWGTGEGEMAGGETAGREDKQVW